MSDFEFGTATFKGIEFEILPVTNSGGRRILTHQYPFSEDHFNEDLGRKPETFSVQGAFVGENVRDQLRLAKRVWQDASDGIFFEPTENKEHAVTLVNWDFNFDNIKLNYITFDLQLVARSDQAYPINSLGSIGGTSQRIDDFIDIVSTVYREAMATFSDIGSVISGVDAAISYTVNSARQIVQAGFATLSPVISAVSGNRSAEVNLTASIGILDTAAEIEAPVAFFRQQSELRLTGDQATQVQGQLYSMLALSYYAERMAEGADFLSLQDFRERATSLKAQATDDRLVSAIDGLILAVGSVAEHVDFVRLEGNHNALVASYQIFGNVSQAYDMLVTSNGVSGARLEGLTYAPNNADI